MTVPVWGPRHHRRKIVTPPASVGGLFHFDGNLTNEISGSFALTENGGSASYGAGHFSSCIQWSTANCNLTSPIITGANVGNGVWFDGWVWYTSSGNDTWIFELISGGVRQAGVGVRPSNSTGLLITSDTAGGTSATTGQPAKDAWGHIAFVLHSVGTSKFVNVAVNGVWKYSGNGAIYSLSSSAGDMSIRCASGGDVGLFRHKYDEFRIRLGKANFPFTVGTNFTPPTSPALPW
ncbi:MAG: hypothetical protein ACKO0Z_02820 [Betaproteobacteria bacterium]